MFEVNHYAYCGMRVPYGEFDTEAEARGFIARRLRRRREQGFPVTTLEPGRKWEVMEPEDCFMVPDQCGTIELSAIQPPEWAEDSEDWDEEPE